MEVSWNGDTPNIIYFGFGFSIIHQPFWGTFIWLVVGPPLWKIWKSVGMIIPNIWENKKWQPNHQPVILGNLPYLKRENRQASAATPSKRVLAPHSAGGPAAKGLRSACFRLRVLDFSWWFQWFQNISKSLGFLWLFIVSPWDFRADEGDSPVRKPRFQRLQGARPGFGWNTSVERLVTGWVEGNIHWGSRDAIFSMNMTISMNHWSLRFLCKPEFKLEVAMKWPNSGWLSHSGRLTPDLWVEITLRLLFRKQFDTLCFYVFLMSQVSGQIQC